MINSEKGLLIDSAAIAKKATEAALEKQAVDILMLDIREEASFADYLVICTAESQRQTQAICEEVERVLKEEGLRPNRREGKVESGWMLLDYGDVIIHVFAPSEREFYNLESLWSKGTPVVRIL